MLGEDGVVDEVLRSEFAQGAVDYVGLESSFGEALAEFGFASGAALEQRDCFELCLQDCRGEFDTLRQGLGPEGPFEQSELFSLRGRSSGGAAAADDHVDPLW